MSIDSVKSFAEKQFIKTKIVMMMRPDTVFYTTILFSLKQEFTESIPTLATNGKKLLINPEFFIKFDQKTQITFLAHETLHVALDHMHRIQDRDPELWNIAADYVINDSLVIAKYVMPDFALHDVAYRDMTTEQVYDKLKEKDDQQKQKMKAKLAAGLGTDIQYPKSGSGSGNAAGESNDNVTKDEVAEIVLRAITQTRAMGKGIGSIPGEILINLDRVINKPLPWHTILQNYLTDYAKDDYSFRRPNKRFLPRHYLPTAYSESIANLAVAVDCSGSVTGEEFNVFIGKIEEILRTMKPKKITVIAFDTQIKNVQTLGPDSDPFKELKFHGRGGTNVAPVLQWAADNKPTVMLVFTDGYFRQCDPIAKEIPMVWVINNNPDFKSEHGKTIHFDI